MGGAQGSDAAGMCNVLCWEPAAAAVQGLSMHSTNGLAGYVASYCAAQQSGLAGAQHQSSPMLQMLLVCGCVAHQNGT